MTGALFDTREPILRNLHIKRWAAEDPDRVALIWEKDEPGEAESVTYGQLLEMVGRKGTAWHLTTDDTGVQAGKCPL